MTEIPSVNALGRVFEINFPQETSIIALHYYTDHSILLSKPYLHFPLETRTISVLLLFHDRRQG